MPVPAATPASAFFAPGSPWAKPYPPITMATRLATFAMVPVKSACMALKPVSNGEPCAIATIGTRKSSARITAAGRAHFDRRRRRIWWMEWTRNQRGIWTSRSLKSAAGGANLTRLNHDVQQLLVTLLFLGGITADCSVATKQNGAFWPETFGEASSGKRLVGEGYGETSKRKGSS